MREERGKKEKGANAMRAQSAAGQDAEPEAKVTTVFSKAKTRRRGASAAFWPL